MLKASTECEIRVSGLVPESVLAEFDGFHAVVEPVQTILRSHIPDQSALHGIIRRLQRLGVELIEVRRLAERPDPALTRQNPRDGSSK